MAISSQTVDIDRVKPARFNPPDRVLKANLKALAEDMRNNGQLSPIHITSDYEVGDGHRRVAAAKMLGWTQIEASIHSDMTVEELWIALNQNTRPIKPASWLYATDNGLDIERVPARYRHLIMEARRWLGEDNLRLLSEHMKSTDVIKTTIKLARYVGDETDATKARILQWLIKHKMHLLVGRYMSHSEASELLLDAIERDAPISFGYTIG